MPIFVELLEEQRLVYVRGTGVLTLADNLYVFQKLLADPRFRPGFSQLADFRDVADAELGEKELREIVANEQAHLGFLEGARIALVAPADFAFGLARMWEILAERMPFEAGVFRSLDEAVAWLGLAPEDLPASCPR